MAPAESSSEPPIDAEFETVETPGLLSRLPNAPGWIAYGVLVMLILAAIFLGLANLLWPQSQALSPSDFARQNQVSALSSDLTSTKAVLAETQGLLDDRSSDIVATRGTIASLSSRLDDVENQLDRIETAVQAIEAGGSSSETDSPNAPSLLIIDRLEALEAQIAAASLASESPQTASEIAALREELQQLQAELENGSTKGSEDNIRSATLALMAITTEAERGRPFLLGYRQLESALPGEPRVLALSSFAVTGAPTLDTLQARFDQVAEVTLAEEAKSDGVEPSWIQELFGESVNVRRTSATPLGEQLNAIRTALSSSNLAEAVAQAGRLDPESSKQVAAWRSDAEKRLNLDKSLDSLRLFVVSKGQP